MGVTYEVLHACMYVASDGMSVPRSDILPISAAFYALKGVFHNFDIIFMIS